MAKSKNNKNIIYGLLAILVIAVITIFGDKIQSDNINNLVEEKPKSIKSATLKTTLPIHARLKSLLHQIAIRYGVKVVIENEETFNIGLIFKTEFATVFFHFEGELAKEALDAANESIEDYIASFRNE